MARQRLEAELDLELSFSERLKADPTRLGLESCLDVHRTRRLEADLAHERLSRRLDEARAEEAARAGRCGFAAVISKGTG